MVGVLWFYLGCWQVHCSVSFSMLEGKVRRNLEQRTFDADMPTGRSLSHQAAAIAAFHSAQEDVNLGRIASKPNTAGLDTRASNVCPATPPPWLSGHHAAQIKSPNPSHFGTAAGQVLCKAAPVALITASSTANRSEHSKAAIKKTGFGNSRCDQTV